MLGAGGAVGHAFHAAVLSVLAEETGWDARTADSIVGTSAGSGVASFLRAGLAPPDLVARAMNEPPSAEGAAIVARAGGPPAASAFEALPPEPGLLRISEPRLLARAARRPWAARIGTIAAAMMPPGRRSTDVIGDASRRLHGERWPDKATWICAVDLERGGLTVFGRDGAPPATMGDAVAASCAIPGWFEPKVINGVRYVDGGVWSPTNADLLAGLDLDLVVVSSPMSTVRRGMRAGVDMAARLLHHRYLEAEMGKVRRAGTHVLAFEPTADDQAVMGVQAMDFSRRPRVARHVRDSVRHRLADPGLARRLRILGDAAGNG